MRIVFLVLLYVFLTVQVAQGWIIGGVQEAVVAGAGPTLFYWDADDVTDTSPNTGTASSLLNSSCTNATGSTGNGVECNASGEYVRVTSSGNIDLTRGIIEFYWKSNAAETDGIEHGLIGNKAVANTAGEFIIRKTASNAFNITFTDSVGATSWMSWNTSRPHWDTNWTTAFTKYEVVWDSTTPVNGGNYIALYVNDILVAPSGAGGNYNAGWTAPTALTYFSVCGNYADSSLDCDGIIDEIYIKNTTTR